jgi:hypothetical protein
MKAHQVLCTAILLMPIPAMACVNDRDTLAEEVRNIRSGKDEYELAVRAISGRFERNPPLYYELRLQRVAQELKLQPSQLDLYDDAAVACDRVGRSGDAIKWIEKKRLQLQTVSSSTPQGREHWYRYYANAGTFWAHRWIRNGAQRNRIAEMKKARELIKQAIDLKPNAHFGREKYQLKAMEWMINPPSLGKASVLPDMLNLQKTEEFIDFYSGSEEGLAQHGYGDAIEGLSGLIVLGNAWESIDVFNTLSHALDVNEKNSLAHLARLRTLELADNGHDSQLPDAPTGAALQKLLNTPRDLGPDTPQQLSETYKQLRAEANSWHQRRTAYMLTRLQQGQHPDTDPNFWNQWQDNGPPPLRPLHWYEKAYAQLAGLGVLALACVLSLSALSRAKGRSFKHHSPSDVTPLA